MHSKKRVTTNVLLSMTVSVCQNNQDHKMVTSDK